MLRRLSTLDRSFQSVMGVLVVILGFAEARSVDAGEPADYRRVIKADVVAIDQPISVNRLGAVVPRGVVYALKRDVEPKVAPAPPPVKASVTTIKGGFIDNKVQWVLQATDVAVGDVVQWVIANDPGHENFSHGVSFLNFKDQAEPFLEILPGGQDLKDQSAAFPKATFPDATNPMGTAGFNAQGTVLLKARIKALPKAGGSIPYLCTIHKNMMTGSLSPPVLKATVTVSGGLVVVAGQPTVRWRFERSAVAIGDVVEWVVGNATGHENVPHGVTFLNFKEQAEPYLEILPGGKELKDQSVAFPKATFPDATNPIGTDGVPTQGTVLLRTGSRPCRPTVRSPSSAPSTRPRCPAGWSASISSARTSGRGRWCSAPTSAISWRSASRTS